MGYGTQVAASNRPEDASLCHGDRKVVLVELTAFEGIAPLASAYLISYARTDPNIAAAYCFTIYGVPVTVDKEELLADLQNERADIYAFSCYLWNMGLVGWLLDRLVNDNPNAHFLLGGPQVMNHAQDYVRPHNPNVAVCNGEGERTFLRYVQELLKLDSDLSRVPGISFWHDGALITTEQSERIRDLTEVPSPFTAGLFPDGRYSFAVLETNRGCPYRCGFCFWGAATNSRINRFETQRVLDDITWLSEHGFATLFLADANWGILPRDQELTEHIVSCSHHTGYPLEVSTNSAKNKPERVAEITRTLVRGGLLTSQPVSLQSMNDEVLALADRSNIRLDAYRSLQRTLRQEGVSSYIEMIWPLPGETTSSFRSGLTDLCRSQADMILVYPHLLLHNTPIYENRDKFGIVVRRVPDDVAEADIVVETNWVTEEDYYDGVWLYYAAQICYNFRGLYYLANYLDRSGRLSFGELFHMAATHMRTRAASSHISDFIERSVRELENYSLINSGELAHLVLHSVRDECDALLVEFCSGLSLGDPIARAALEVDLLARPYIYREKPRKPQHEFTQLGVEEYGSDGFGIELPASLGEMIAELEGLPSVASNAIQLVHAMGRKLPFMPSRSLNENTAYCQGMTLCLREILPRWRWPDLGSPVESPAEVRVLADAKDLS